MAVTTSRKSSGSAAATSYIKWLFNVYNILLFLNGCGLFAIVAWMMFWKYAHIMALTGFYSFGINLMVIATVCTLFASVIGFFVACRTVKGPLLLIYMFIVLIACLGKLTVGGLTFVYDTRINDELNPALNRTFMAEYAVNTQITSSIDFVQQNFKCCGALRFEDWKYSLWLKGRRRDLLIPKQGHLVPDSCCLTMRQLCGRRDHPSNIFYMGCIYRVTDEILNQLATMRVASFAVSGIELCGIIISCCLFVKLRKLVTN